ncbi:YkuS family protein [Metabacillus sp. RGM 3146]|uniref:YkuS family protein n=1 Tax=Metabacillus sp. RGM 3146 TaxID=3401092 RepID=UPI003B9A27A5
MAKIGVEESLTNVQEALREIGYEVVEIKSEADMQGCDYCVVTGLDENMMGVSDTVSEGAVIDASGYSAEEICQHIQNKMSQA